MVGLGQAPKSSEWQKIHHGRLLWSKKCFFVPNFESAGFAVCGLAFSKLSFGQHHNLTDWVHVFLEKTCIFRVTQQCFMLIPALDKMFKMKSKPTQTQFLPFFGGLEPNETLLGVTINICGSGAGLLRKCLMSVVLHLDRRTPVECYRLPFIKWGVHIDHHSLKRLAKGLVLSNTLRLWGTLVFNNNLTFLIFSAIDQPVRFYFQSQTYSVTSMEPALHTHTHTKFLTSSFVPHKAVS